MCTHDCRYICAGPDQCMMQRYCLCRQGIDAHASKSHGVVTQGATLEVPLWKARTDRSCAPYECNPATSYLRMHEGTDTGRCLPSR